ncbi:hypothetical protein GWI33_006316 [Rhynchophorus ferrugineus]|uniref:Protein rolling stone n=1 Tax=Rhynchophorus ferrugineus TaxID=354439 RepID=A0A834IG57_RHYFE|nr:hypothetical protein GWI33_006316 [Rhynchophorus ferrugineus]
MVGPSWKKYFSLRQVSLAHERPITFILSQWQTDRNVPNIKYCIYRVCVFLTFFVSWVFSIANEKTHDGSTKWAIYLTNWGYTICMLQALSVSIMILISCILPKRQGTILTLYPVYWLLNIIATPVAFTITVIYWTLIYNAEQAKLDAMNFLVHGCNSILMYLDLWVVSHPVKIFHFLYPLALSFIYAIFTYIYYACGGVSKDGTPYIYPIIKWDQPSKTTLVCFSVMVFMILIHICTFGMYKGRLYIYELIMSRKTLPPKSPQDPKGYDNTGMTTETV